MRRMNHIRNMLSGEVARVHRVHRLVGNSDSAAIELLADLRAYCGRAWPVMLLQAMERYELTRTGDDMGLPSQTE